jgi:magnesium-transporting ATPase (P-type)
MNLTALLLSIVGPFVGITSPVTVMQMLWINMIMDTLAGLAFSYEAPIIDYMRERPIKKEESILNKYMYITIC